MAAKVMLPGGITVYDLTRHPLGPSTPTYPGDPRFEATTYASHQSSGYYARRICMPEHIGTHIDAPRHFDPQGASVDKLGIENLVAPAIAVEAGPGRGKIDGEEINAALHACGLAASVLRGKWLLVKTRGRLLGETAARLLLENEARGLGVDTPSPDEEPYPVHHVLLSNGVPILENLVIPRELVCRGFLLVAAPLPLEEGSGSPARVYAILAPWG